MRTCFLGATLLLAGCVTVDNKLSDQWLRYRCSDGQIVVARYDSSDAANPRAELIVYRRHVRFEAERSGSGARYVTRDGLSGGHGMVWWTKGDEATLFETRNDDPARPLRALASCTTVA